MSRSSLLALPLGVLALLVLGAPVAAAPVDRLEVRIVTGADGADPGAIVELRVQELGGQLRTLPLTRGEAWPPGSTRVIPVPLARPLESRSVARFGISYRGRTAGDAWEIESAEVFALGAAGRERLLDATLQGTVRSGVELSTPPRAASTLTCVSDADCDDGRLCNGRERCAPGDAGANARGCVRGAPLACPTNQVCIEGQGCRGPDGAGRGGFAVGEAAEPREPTDTPLGRVRERPTPALQSCRGNEVVLTEADGSIRVASCPAGTGCVTQPNGTGVCAPAGAR